MTDQVYQTSFDAWVNQARTDNNYGDSDHLRMDNTTSNKKYGFLHFPLQLPSDATIISATLTMYLDGAWDSSNTVTVSRVTQKWREGRVSYTNMPTVTATGAATAAVTSGVNKQALSATVTTIVQSWVNGSSNYGLRLANSVSGIRDIFSSEHANPAVRPILTVTYSLPPDAPRDLRADGDRAVSTSHPVLLWTSDTPTNAQIVVDNNSDFSSPLIDPGYIAQSEQQFDTAAYTALTDNTQYYWKVRIKDANGVASAYSDSASFYYRTLGSLAISVPSGSTVTSTTPTFTHALTGRTQAYVEYELFEDGVSVYKRDRLATTATSFVVPAGYIKDPSASYIMYIRVWDNYDREGLGGALAYTQASKTFTLTTGATQVPTALAATQVKGHVHLTWTKGTTPDNFVLLANGVVVDDDIDPALALISGTSYQWDYYSAIPWTGTAVSYTIRAELSSILSASSTASTLEFKPIGVWLIETTGAREVQILGQENIDSKIGEIGVVYFPVGRRDPLRIIDSIRGYEGTVSGVLSEHVQTLALNLAGIQYIKGHPTADLRLVYGHRNMPVIIAETSLELLANGPETYAISFEYYQTGEFDIDLEG